MKHPAVITASTSAHRGVGGWRGWQLLTDWVERASWEVFQRLTAT
jgi:hypothetical protein